jgi:hypothetical protein
MQDCLTPNSRITRFEVSNSKRIEGICPYCGKQAILTRDHVIPRSLYINGVPDNSPKVLACSQCNNVEKSALDTYLRDFLIVDIEGSEHPVSKQLFPKLARSISRNHSKLARHTMGGRLMPRYTPEGLFADFVYGTQLPDKSITKAITTVTRGLYTCYTKNIFPQTVPFEVYRQWDMKRQVADIQMLLKVGGQYKAAGDGDIFECIYGFVPERPTITLWLLSFLRKVYFSVATDRLSALMQNAS